MYRAEGKLSPFSQERKLGCLGGKVALIYC